MDSSHETQTLDAALLEFQKRIEPIKRDARNTHFKNTYATIDAVTEQVLPLLNELGVVVMQFVETVDDANGLSTVIRHVATGEFYGFYMALTPVDKTPQGLKAAVTYARRTQLTAFLGLATEDDDGNVASGRGPVEESPKPQWGGKK